MVIFPITMDNLSFYSDFSRSPIETLIFNQSSGLSIGQIDNSHGKQRQDLGHYASQNQMTPYSMKFITGNCRTPLRKDLPGLCIMLQAVVAIIIVGVLTFVFITSEIL